MTIKQKIIDELQNPEMLDLKFLFSENVLDLSLEILDELLESEKEDFEKKLALKNEEITFESFLDNSSLDLFFSLLSHLQNVQSSEKIRNIIEQFEPKYIDFGNYIAYNKRYYEMLVYCLENCPINLEQKRILDLSIKSYKVKGIDLEKEKQDRLKAISKRLSEISQKFGNNLLDSEKEFIYVFKNIDSIKDIPENELEEVQKKAIEAGQEGYLFDSSPASYMSVMKYCSDGEIRKHFFKEKAKFASSGKYDNRPIILEILKLREEKSKILGYKNYAELSLEFKMADSPENVIKLIDRVTQKAKNKAIQEVEDLKKYFKLESFNIWDLTYYSRIFKEKEFKYDERELKKYFEFSKVLNGLFEIVNKLYGIEMKKIEIDSYSNDILFFEVYKNGELISYFIGDYFYNKDKRSGAWCDNLRPKIMKNEKYNIKNTIIPIMINVCAFQKGEKGKTLLNFIDVETMFHEFGHAIHEMLSKSEFSDLSGFNVEWDFVELPSQLMENWASEEESLKLFAKHNETGGDIPKSMLSTMEKLKTYGSGNFMLRQNEFASLDMHLHSKTISNNIDELDENILLFINNSSIFKKDEDYKMYASFSHIFDGGYGAGYYSYMWAEIIEAQVWSIFKNNGIFDKKTADRFLDTILSAGTFKDAKDLFYDFAGVDISELAFLERKGFI